jgi:hypothetical protein
MRGGFQAYNHNVTVGVTILPPASGLVSDCTFVQWFVDSTVSNATVGVDYTAENGTALLGGSCQPVALINVTILVSIPMSGGRTSFVRFVLGASCSTLIVINAPRNPHADLVNAIYYPGALYGGAEAGHA